MRTSGSLSLVPERDVVLHDGRCVATSREPWLRLTDFRAFRPGRFVEVTYRAGLFDNPARPVLRFLLADGGCVERILAAPVAGAAIWIGRVPPGATGLSISPTHEVGRFDFEIESVRRVWAAALLVRGWRQARRPTFSTVATRLLGWRPEAEVNLAWAIGFTPLSQYESWKAARVRKIDLGGIDAPRADWQAAPRVAISVDIGAGASALAATIASLEGQIYPSWLLFLRGEAGDPETERVADDAARRDPRIRRVALDELPADLPDEALVGALAGGDILHPWALACVVEEAARSPSAQIFYGDEERRCGSGREPVFKPGWSPWLAAAKPYLGQAAFVRLGQLRALNGTWPAHSGDWLAPIAARTDPAAVRHIRRVLAETIADAAPERNGAGVQLAPTEADATIIVPTRDRLDLLKPCLEGLQHRTHGRFEVIVVDNDSSEPETHEFFRQLTAADARFRVLPFPGAFNYAAICNAAAAASQARVLVFLNSDTEVVAEDWLAPLLAAAVQPNVGAVGAKLLFPDGRIQHVGVVVGMGESAGHFGAQVADGAAGWFGTNLVAHEASAVTGACQAIERSKFEAIGGFDAESLPIELNDVDLCLRAAARGWKTVVMPQSRLIHKESGSRGGATFRRLSVYAGQRAVFCYRWRSVLRHDPYFHPGLSLYHHEPALG